MCRTVSHEEIFDIFDEEPPAPPSSDLTSSTSHQGPSITTHTNDNIENHGITLGTGIGLGIGIGITAGCIAVSIGIGIGIGIGYIIFKSNDDTQREAKFKELENECNKQVLIKHVSLDKEMIETVSQVVSATNDSSPTSSNSNKSSVSTTADIRCPTIIPTPSSSKNGYNPITKRRVLLPLIPTCTQQTSSMTSST
ncbi:unnamed protein product [Rotaria sp. Silwood1]|nr:unnamed protein product [Rotaria sp. Silwood1]CAF1647606.1 unnamed protein product [Rotaria sp. Silwood1]